MVSLSFASCHRTLASLSSSQATFVWTPSATAPSRFDIGRWIALIEAKRVRSLVMVQAARKVESPQAAAEFNWEDTLDLERPLTSRTSG